MIKIELDELNGAFDGDLVIAKRVFNPKSIFSFSISFLSF